ncbi:MAG TPA: GEVED domain-containing protein [Flavobacterium sp.]|jgi:hypothetical protein
MKQIYLNLKFPHTIKTAISSLCFSLLATLLFIPCANLSAQTFTLGEGTLSSGTLGVSPFAMVNTDQRSQYIYYGPELHDAGAAQVASYITEFALNITELSTTSDLYPQNVTIKMGHTFDPVLGPTLVSGLTTVYTASVETITETGWHTFVLDTPFEWDGERHIIVEICRDNSTFGTNFEVEAEQFFAGDYRTAGLYENEGSTSGCNLSGDTPMSNGNRRTRPNAQFTIALICDGVPTGGTTAVGAGPYCDGTPFNLTVTGGDLASGLSYQWQSSPHSGGPWSDINGATASSYSGTQTTATYYRRVTRCENTNETANAVAVLVNGPGCYCEAPTETPTPTGITHVGFSTIDNFTSSNQTYNFYNSNATVVQNASYTLSVNVNAVGGTNYTTAWIDWNSNGDFENSEMVNLGTVTGGSNVSSGIVASVIVPGDAVVGTTHMRVRTQQSPANQAAAACGDITMGETEDYSLIIQDDAGINNVGTNAASVLVFGTDHGLQLKMKHGNIAAVAVYDLSGRMLRTVNELNVSELLLPEFQGAHNVLIVRITSDSGAVVTRKVVL